VRLSRVSSFTFAYDEMEIEIDTDTVFVVS
jgi:hypothetical protein